MQGLILLFLIIQCIFYVLIIKYKNRNLILCLKALIRE